MNLPGRAEDLAQPELARLTIDLFRRSALHYGMWFNEVQHQLGLEEALKTEADVFAKFFPIAARRLGNAAGFEVQGDLPSALLAMPRERLLTLLDAVAANWLAGDGIWFQTVEERQEIYTAKRCNDTCWAKFSPLEAYRIRELLQLPENGGLDALEVALGLRLYARINEQASERHEDSLIYKMIKCRVQDARKRKGLADYPCKSGGMVEYSSFARSIDERIKTECVACPPDDHPVEWFCSWRFSLK